MKVKKVHCPICGSNAERCYLPETSQVRTECSHCDYSLAVDVETGAVIESNVPEPRGSFGIELTIRVNTKHNSTDETSTELATLCRALNAYHIAIGGNGLAIDEWDNLVEVPELIAA